MEIRDHIRTKCFRWFALFQLFLSLFGGVGRSLESLVFLDVFGDPSRFLRCFVSDNRRVLFVKLVCYFGRAGDWFVIEGDGLIFGGFGVAVEVFDDFK